MRPIITDRVAWFVGRSVCRSATVVSPAKTGQPIKVPFELRIRVGLRNVLDWRFRQLLKHRRRVKATFRPTGNPRYFCHFYLSAREPWLNRLTFSNKSSAVAEMGDRLATIDVGRKVGRGCCGWGSPLSHHLTQCGWAEAYLFTKWHLDPSNRLATILATIVGMPRSSA